MFTKKTTAFIRGFLFASLSFLVFTGCSTSSAKDVLEDVTGDIIDGDDFTAKINGKDFGAPLQNVTAEITVQSGIYAIAMSAGDAEGISKLKGIVLAMAGLDFDALSAGKVFDTITTGETEGAAAGYAEDDAGNEENDFDTEITQEIYIKITALDKTDKLISGEFNFKVLDEDTNKTYTATEGQFSNIPYEFQN